MKLNSILICIIFSMFIIGCAPQFEDPLESRAEYEFGVMEYEVIETYDKQSDVAGKRSFGEIQKIRSGSKIKIQQGRTFGIQFNVPKTFNGQGVSVKQIVEFPNGGLINPTTKRVSKRIELEDIEYEFEEPFHLAYILDQPWEMKKGKWTFSVFLNNQKYIEHEFTLY